MPGAERMVIILLFLTDHGFVMYSSVQVHLVAPLLQFWHYEVADPSAKAVPKIEEPKPKPQGFPKGLGDPGTSHFA